MNFMQRVIDALYRFMYGRYGYDELNTVLLIAGVILSVLSYLPYLGILSLLSMAVMVWALFRSLSRNMAGRRREFEKYLQIKGKVKTFFNLRRRMWRERKTHRYFHCKYCRAMLRVPKGRGVVDVGCPRCKGRTTKKT